MITPKLLEKIGLTHRESVIYLTLLQLGTSKTGPILKNSKLNTGKIYEILEGLKQKGLISESIINNVRHFTAASPSKILEFIKRKEEKISDEKKIVKQALSELEQLRNSTFQEPKSITYTGFEGFKTAVYECYNDLEKDEEMLGMGATNLKSKKTNEFWINFSKERIKKGIKVRIIFSEEKGDLIKKFQKFKHTKVRVIKGVTPATVSIFGNNKTLITNYKKPITCTLIYDKYTADSFKLFFNQLWDKAK